MQNQMFAVSNPSPFQFGPPPSDQATPMEIVSEEPADRQAIVHAIHSIGFQSTWIDSIDIQPTTIRIYGKAQHSAELRSVENYSLSRHNYQVKGRNVVIVFADQPVFQF